MTQLGLGLTYAGITSDTISNSPHWPRVHHASISREKSNMSFIKSLFTSAASFAIAIKSGRLCTWTHEVCGLRNFGRPSLCATVHFQSSILEWVHDVLLHLEQPSASQTAAGRQWLGDLDWPVFSIRASWSQTDGVGMATLIEGTKKVSHLGSSSRHYQELPSITLLSVNLQYNSGVAHISSRTSLGQAIGL